MKTCLLVFTLVLCLALPACTINIDGNELGSVRGSGNVVTEERSISGVERVAVMNQGDLTIVIGAEESLVIEAEDNLLPYIETKVRGSTLEIGTQNGVNLRNTDPIRYTLTVPSLKEVVISSSGDITVPALTADSFDISVSSSGDVNIESLAADKLEVHLSSSGKVGIGGGQVARMNATLSSSGDLNMENVVVQDARVSISSSGSAYVQVTGALDGNISSSGNIYVTGSPQIDVSTSSSGKVIAK